ncbi:hypothetical protein cypCar_00017645 [Cyprinus carpio]|nr:hypothetical protein cypCar_00017645 [Cyprinus carpio]
MPHLLSLDSNSTEDESAEPQVSMEMKEHFMPPQGEAINSQPTDVEGPMEIFGNYMSVEEDPAEAPMSEPALKNAVVAAGSVMMLQKGGKLVPREELICTANLLVIPSKEPLFTRKLEALEATEGRSAQFDCKVSGSPPPEVNWTHCEQPVVESDNIRIVKVNGRHSLFITHINKESEGLYTVFARNVHGEAESSAELYVQEPRPAISTHMSRLEKMPSIPEEPEVFEGEVEHRTIPDFIKPLSDLEVVEGKEAVLKCRVTGLPYPKIIWYHNGTKIESSDDRKMIQYRDVHSLVINSVCHGHSGVYKCVISNNVGKAVCYAHLYVAVSLPEPPDGPPVIESVTGRTVSLSWKIPKNLNPPIDPASLMYIVQQQALGSTQWTTIASSLKDTSYTVTSLSKGVCYSFRVLNTTGKASSKPSQPTDLVQLCDRGQYLHKAPVILDKPDIVYVVENQPVTITITLNHVRATGTWKRRGVMLLNKPGALEMTMPDDDQHALHIAKVKSTDVGQLIFMANNQYGSDLCTLQLAMAVPPSFETIMEDLDVCVGETSRFAVVVDGKPDPDILWYKDNVLLAESSHFTFVYDDRECSLVVLNAQPEDEGVYTCTAKNQAGSVSCKAELTVHTDSKVNVCGCTYNFTAKNVEEKEEQMEDEGTILWRMRRLTDYYDIHKEIGRGAFSYIKRVTQPNGQTFAAKFISLRAKRKACALREMTLLSELDHEKIIHFYDAFEKRRVVVIITELCHEELLERITKRTTILESEVQSIIRQLLEGIDYLHQNDIIHLDIKPENILMADQKSDHIRICDFGNALKVEPNEELYCKYGTPEFIAPEIINQSPISKSTDICLTGVSPFAGENDRDTLLNIRSYNVAFEERMFKDLCREAKGFIIKLLVASKLRPDATECLLHPWFKSLVKGKSINTTLHKQVLARRKWQCSLIRYKSKMVMRSISELLDDSSSHVSLAVPRNLKEGSPPPSSSSDSDEDIDELPFIPMPQTMMFSGSRMSLTEIHEDDVDVIRGSNESYQENMNRLEDITECQTTDGQRDVDHLEIAERTVNLKDSFQRGSSVEAEQVAGKSRRALMRRGSSADSALLLQITPEDDNMNNTTEEVQKHMQKAVSMELPHSSNSPKTGRLSKEDYALKLDLMRQRLLKRGTVDKNMSGLHKKPLEINDRMSLVACPDGRQLLMIMKTSKKDAGIYECVASNNLASATSSCILSIACVPKRPGTPEIPQIYNNTALVQWKPSDSKVPCTYTLEKKCDGDDKWVTEATGVTDCFYNSSVFPTGSTIQFRVACVNKAGQGPYSNVSKGVRINVEATCSVAPTPISPPVILVKSISPIGEGASSPPQKTPMERVVSTTKTETTLKQGVPQKPYSFFDEKARGRFGVIRDCRENSTGKMFIAKIIPYDQQAKQAVIKEYEILKSLRCERIMALHEAYITPRYLVLITEYCTGKEILYSLIERFCYSEDDVVGFIVQILQGLEYLHNCRILHLDIKPDNIMVTNLNVIKIIDFGSAQRFNPLSLKQYSRELGTLEYMAPELLKGDLVGPPADIWSLGVLSYIMLSGRLPFQDKDPKLTETKIHAAKFDSTKLYPKVSQSASTFLKKTLNGYPWCRPTIKDCLNHSWLHDSYLKKLRRQTLTFTTTRLKEFLEEHQRRCAESATKHQVLLRVYQSGSSSPASPTKSSSPSTPISEEKH